MKTTGPYLFIQIGLIIRLLRNLSTNFSVSFALRETKKLLQNFERAEFAVSSAGSKSLEDLIAGFEKAPDSRKFTAAEVASFHQIIGVMEPMVQAEAHTKRLYSISENRFNLDALLNKPEAMFSTRTFSRLPQIARQDITAAFQCLAFDQPTAVAFHILRACEAVLKAYYHALIRQKRLETPMWGNMLDALERRRKSDQKLLTRLRFVKDSFRNPTSHPEAIFTLHEAQDLIGICIDVINRMAASLDEMEAAPRKG